MYQTWWIPSCDSRALSVSACARQVVEGIERLTAVTAHEIFLGDSNELSEEIGYGNRLSKVVSLSIQPTDKTGFEHVSGFILETSAIHPQVPLLDASPARPFLLKRMFSLHRYGFCLV